MNPSGHSNPPISYSHYQPPPQPIQFPYPAPQQQPQQYGMLPPSYPAQLEKLQQRGNPSSMSTFAPLNIGNPFAQLGAFQQQQQQLQQQQKTVGMGQDFQLFGPSDPLGGIGAGIMTDDDEEAEARLRRQLGSIDSSVSQTVPDLISDRGSPSVDSPPSPAFAPSKLPPLRPTLSSQHSNGSYRGEGRASSVPPPEFPRPIRRKTQEIQHWPSFVSSGSSASSASSGSNYLPTPHQYPQSSLPFVDEPSNYLLPPSSTSASFDPASLSLSPAQYPYSYQAPHTDHPLLPSEQSDLLDRVRRDLLDVDLSSIKGPLRALALSGGEGTPGQFSMVNPLPSYSRYWAAGGGAGGGAAGGSGVGRGGDRDKTPTPRAASNVLSPRSPAISALAQSESVAASSIGTVSPQEAFLDYPAVDSKLHDLDPKDGKLARSDFGVGVGHSLFAPLPATTASPSQLQTKSGNKVKQRLQPATSNSKVPPPPSASTQSRSPTPHAVQTQSPSTSTSNTPTLAQKAPRPHVPHPFSVPQNAVSWATRRSNSGRHLVGGVIDGDADDDDGDFGEPSSSTEVTAAEEEEEENERKLDAMRNKAGLPKGFGRFDVKDVGLDRDTTEIERHRYGLERAGEVAGSRPIKEEGGNYEYKVPMVRTSADADVKKGRFEMEDQKEPAFSFVPPPSQSTSLLQFASPRRSPPSSTQPLYAFASAKSGTSTPRRAAAANALAGLHPHSPADAEEPPSSLATAPAIENTESTRSKRQRKRSRLAMEEEEDNYSGRDLEASSDEYREDEEESTGFAPARKAEVDDESDESYHSSSNAPTPAASNSASSGRRAGNSNVPTPKRRRRAPAAAASTSSGPRGGKPNAKGSIACDHVASDGARCGVVFRRPYDLARHKETIHGVTMGGEKLPPGKAKEWKCRECGGTFSRKDALLRHGRIRGHKPGL
ncbi:hypothetical protein JCM16303_000191 [Sporobolomyces ruberrimus]